MRRIGLLISQLFLLLLFINTIKSFNLDVANYIRHEGQNGSMFGFSVALHREKSKSWVMIGAPNADTSQYQQGVRNGGAVYRCDISDDNRCLITHFDSNGTERHPSTNLPERSRGNNYNERNEQVDTKSYQWFGATVASAGIDGPVVACAPRYVYHQHQPKKVERIEPVGTCFIAKNNFQDYQEFSPCRTVYWGYHRQGSCQAGLSAAVTKEGDRLFIGAPGSWYWQGQVYSINTDAVVPFKPPRYGQFGDGGQMYSYSLHNPKDRVYSTKESVSREDDSYLGYSSTTGDFSGDGSTGVAVGMPRGAGLLGKVLIFSWNLTNNVNITGEQIGAYFGYSLCSVDVDGDNLVDLIVGAPMYTEKNNEGKYENGRVYIIYQGKTDKFKMVETREGLNSKARFGLALTSLNDINLDGYGDFAVGAPYDGPNNRGAVYIYYGSRIGPLKKASQVIYAEDISQNEYISTFGFSLAGGIDLDKNLYPDMAVGAYESDRVFVFKSRPVAVMEIANVNFEVENKLISLERKDCQLRDGKKVTCMPVTSCLMYTGQNVPQQIDLEMSWVLDSKKPKTSRMFFIVSEGQNIRNSSRLIYRGRKECHTESVYIADGIRDKLTALEVEMRYNIRRNPSYTSTSRRIQGPNTDPVLDENRGTIQRDSINIMKNCGKDNICIPDMRLKVEAYDSYVLGGNESLIIEVYITNHGEDAFEASFYMVVPQGLDYKATRKIGEYRDTSYICTAPSVYTNHTLKCDIGNPLPAGKFVNFKVIFEPSKTAGISPFYDFYMEANSTNEEAEGSRIDNIFKKSIAISIESDVTIGGSSNPSEFHYNVSHYKAIENATNEAEIGPQVVHIYDFRNNGTSAIEEMEIFITWPAMTLEKEHLMYLLNQPETQGNVYCEPSQFVNMENLQIDRALERKSYLDKNRDAKRHDNIYEDDRKQRWEFENGHYRELIQQDGSTVRIFNSSYSEFRNSSHSFSGKGEIDKNGHFRWITINKDSNLGGLGTGSIKREYREIVQQDGSIIRMFNSSYCEYQNSTHLTKGSGEIMKNGRFKWNEIKSVVSLDESENTGGTVTNFENYKELAQRDGGIVRVYNSSYCEYRNATHFMRGSGVINNRGHFVWKQIKSIDSIVDDHGGRLSFDGRYREFVQSDGGYARIFNSSYCEYRNSTHFLRGSGFVDRNGRFQWNYVQSVDIIGDIGGGGSDGGSFNFDGGSYREIVQNDGTIIRVYNSTYSEFKNSTHLIKDVGSMDKNGLFRWGDFSTNWDKNPGSGGSWTMEKNTTTINGNTVTSTRFKNSSNVIEVQETSTQTIITGGLSSRFETAEQQRLREYTEKRRQHEEREKLRQIEEQNRYKEDLRRYEEEQRRNKEEFERQEELRRQRDREEFDRLERIRLQRERDEFERNERIRIEWERQQRERNRTAAGRISGNSGSRTTPTRTSSSNTRGYGEKVDINFNSNVDQDISTLAARTHAQQSGSDDSSSSIDFSGRRRMMSQQDGEPPRPDLVTGATALEKAAQGGQGFQTVGLDLGIFQATNNLDEEARSRSGFSGSSSSSVSGGRTGSSSSISGGGQTGSSSISGGRIGGSSSISGGGQTGSSSSSSNTHSYSSQTNYNQQFGTNDEEYGDEYDDIDDNDQGNIGGGNVQSSHSSYSYSSNSNAPQYRRVRDVSTFDNAKPLCGSASCVSLRCVVGPLDRNSEALIALRTRLVAHTLDKIGGDTEVRLSTMAIGKITKLPYIGSPANETLKTHEVFVSAIPDPTPKPDVIPLWVFVLAACAGALILLLLIYLLYKCGFFKRNRPTGSPHERQPLNRNGNYHGDEHL